MELSTHILILIYVIIFLLIWIAGELYAIKKSMGNILDVTEMENDRKNNNIEDQLADIKKSLEKKN